MVLLNLDGKNGFNMELIKVIAKTSFVSQVVGSVNRKQELNVSKALAEHLSALNLVDYPQKQDSVIDAGEVTQSASLPAETVSRTTTSKTSGRGRRGKQS